MIAPTAVRERGILFSAPMVRAILDGTKTQTRRVVRAGPQVDLATAVARTYESHLQRFGNASARALKHLAGKPWSGQALVANLHHDLGYAVVTCPRGSVGDRLWVRETWQHADWTEDGEPFVRYAADGAVRFCADTPEGEVLVGRWEELSEAANYAIDGKAADRRWRPSIFMPRWASRITLEITDVRVERLQDISDKDCIAEGVGAVPLHTVSAYELYLDLWGSLNAKRAPWAANDYVWVITFRRVR